MEEQNNPNLGNQEPETKEAKPINQKMPMHKMAIIICAIVIVVETIMLLGGINGNKEHSHIWCEWQDVKTSTCTEEGNRVRVCNACGEQQTIGLTPIGHDWGTWNETTKVTCLSNGSEERICATCQTKEKRTIYAKGYHNYGDWNRVQQATCISESIEERTCVCGKKETRVISGFTKHNYIDGVCSECNKELNRIEITNKQSTIFLPDMPLQVGSLATTVELSSLSYTIDNKYIYLSLSGEKTYFYFSGPHYIDILFKIYDSDGILIYSTSLYVSDMSVGDKFKDKVVELPISKLDYGENYTLSIVYGS